MGRRLRFSWANDVRDIAYKIVEYCPTLSYLDLSRMYFVRSYGSKSIAIARVHTLPPVWRFVLNMKPVYAIEVISEKYDTLPLNEKVEIILHELLHIPKSMGGGLRPHSREFYSELESMLRCIFSRLRSKE